MLFRSRWTFSDITDKQITRAINKLKPHKATRRGTVPNSFLKNTKHLLVPFIGPLFRATQHLDYYPPDWALNETLALKKPGKPNYSSPSAWQPIVLSNRLACLLNACITDMVVTICKKLHLLPNHHFGVMEEEPSLFHSLPRCQGRIPQH